MSNGIPAEAPAKPRHHMLQEIYEQPAALRATLLEHISPDGRIVFDRDELSLSLLRSLERVVFVASGASRHAALAGKLMIEELAGVDVDVEHASEYCCRKPSASARTLVVAMTQSGETADTVAALRRAAAAHLSTLAICNVAASTIVRESNSALVTNAGVEIAVPSTKSFTCQLAAVYLLALHLAQARCAMPGTVAQSFLSRLLELPALIESRLDRFSEEALAIAREIHPATSVLMVGRGVHRAIALEAALKLKETAYIHAEGFPSGEFRHGPTALADESTPLLVLATCDASDADSRLRYEKSAALFEELRTLSGHLLLLACDGDPLLAAPAAGKIAVPDLPELLMPIVEIVPLQLLAYHCAVLRGNEVDFPRNLAKFVKRD